MSSLSSLTWRIFVGDCLSIGCIASHWWRNPENGCYGKKYIYILKLFHRSNSVYKLCLRLGLYRWIYCWVKTLCLILLIGPNAVLPSCSSIWTEDFPLQLSALQQITVFKWHSWADGLRFLVPTICIFSLWFLAACIKYYIHPRWLLRALEFFSSVFWFSHSLEIVEEQGR